MFWMRGLRGGRRPGGSLTGLQSVPERYALYRGRTMRFVSSSPEPCALAVMNECPRSGGAVEEISS